MLCAKLCAFVSPTAAWQLLHIIGKIREVAATPTKRVGERLAENEPSVITPTMRKPFGVSNFRPFNHVKVSVRSLLPPTLS